MDVGSSGTADRLMAWIADHAGAALAGGGEPMSRSSIFGSKKSSDRPGLLLIHASAVQRPNESNPLGLCCDIVKPVFSDWTRKGDRGGPDGGAKGSLLFKILPVSLSIRSCSRRSLKLAALLTASGAAKASSPAHYRCAEKVIESPCAINTAPRSIRH